MISRVNVKRPVRRLIACCKICNAVRTQIAPELMRGDLGIRVTNCFEQQYIPFFDQLIVAHMHCGHTTGNFRANRHDVCISKRIIY